MAGSASIAFATHVGSATAVRAFTCSASAGAEFVSFEQHLEDLSQADAASHLSQPKAAVLTADAVEEMRSGLLEVYEPMTPSHSYMDEHGQIWDVIPVADQPTLRNSDGSRRPIATPPDPPPPLVLPESSGSLMVVPSSPDRRDGFGNSMYSPDGFIPFRRQTLEEAVRARTLGGLISPRAEDSGSHVHATAFQDVDCIAAGSMMSVYGPAVNAHQTSISQQWISAGTGDDLQTIESGWWSNCAIGRLQPTFFVAASSNDYREWCLNTNKCTVRRAQKPANYGFVHKKNIGVAPGGVFPNISAPGAKVYVYGMHWTLHESGNWWLYITTGNEFGSTQRDFLGYFPAEIFAGGKLASGADEIEFGGEAVVYDGETTYPAMGDGSLPPSNFNDEGAFHASVIYQLKETQSFSKANLATQQKSDPCYAARVYGGDTVAFGGPGGTACSDN